MNNYKFPDVVSAMRVYWLEGQYGGMRLNGHLGYREIDPEYTSALLKLEFEPYELPVIVATDFN